MYDLPYFKEKDEKEILFFIHKNPFALIAGCDINNKPVATQVPVFIEEENGRRILRGHIMKNTDHHQAFLHNQNVLVVFSGQHSYVSATWYSNPHQASTWNYMSVHAKGLIRFLDDAGLEEVLRKTTLHFENYNQESTTVFDNLPDDYKQKLMKAIVAFEIEVKELENVFKLSQNRDKESYENIKEKLNEQGNGGAYIASEMEKRTDELFPQNEEWNPEKFLS
ncbi:MAG TPA: FMN-binding negative transcriptional regulator [Flavisolibacter sp.]|nr:FMN-binding negative transcriptional regulator [Flavisolibacter sp.]